MNPLLRDPFIARIFCVTGFKPCGHNLATTRSWLAIRLGRFTGASDTFRGEFVTDLVNHYDAVEGTQWEQRWVVSGNFGMDDGGVA